MGQSLRLHHWQRIGREILDEINNFIMVENYQNIPNGNIDYALYTNLSGSTNMAAVAQDGDNKYLEFFPTNNDTHTFTNHIAIPDGQPFTFYCKFKIDKNSARVNTQIRFQGTNYFRVKFDTDFTPPLMFWYDNPNHTGGAPTEPIDQSVDEDTWYELWIHLDGTKSSTLHPDTASAGRWQAWIRGGVYDTITRITVDDDDPDKYVYHNGGTISNVFLIGWTNTDQILHDNFYVHFGEDSLLEAPSLDRIWFDKMQGFNNWNYTDGAWKGQGKNTFEDGDHVGFVLGPVTIQDDVKPGSIVCGANTTLQGNYPLSGDFKVFNGFLRFDEYNTPVEFDSLYVANNARFWYLDSWGFIADDPNVLLLGTGDITLDGGILKIQTRATVFHELPNKLLVTEKGGWLEVNRASGNPEKHFTGEITLRGNLRGSADAGSGDQLTLVGNITIENDLMIRGTEFSNNTFFVIKGDVTGDYELLLNMESANSRIRLDGSTVTVGLLKIQSVPDENIRSAIQANAGTTINNDVEILEDSRFWIDSGNDSIFDTTRIITVHQDAEELRNDSDIALGALVYGATSLDPGTYAMAQVETFFGDPGKFNGTGTVTVTV